MSGSIEEEITIKLTNSSSLVFSSLIPFRGAKEALIITNRPMASNELFEVEVTNGGGNSFKGVKKEVKSALKGKEFIRIGVTAHW